MDPSNIEREISTGVIIGRFVVLFAAAAAFAAAVFLSQRLDHAAANSTEQYVCPMHPQVVSTTPGDCPICNMALERVHGTQPAPSTLATGRLFDAVKRRVVTQVVRAPAWIEGGDIVTAILYKESLHGLAPGAEARFFRETEPAKAIPVRLTAEPVASWDSSTVRVHFVGDRLPQVRGETGWLQLDAQPREHLVVPESSVLYASDGAYVLVVTAREHALARRSIQIGRRLDSGYVADQEADRLGEIIVLSGLQEGERVAIADTFFLDAEQRLRKAQGKSEEVFE